MKQLLTLLVLLGLCIPAVAFSTTDAEDLSEDEKDTLVEELQDILFRTLQIQLSQITESDTLTCPVLSRNLYIADTGLDVTQLQIFLKNLGSSVYPEGQVTGNYGTLTRRAVERFQVKTGIFGPGQVGYGVTGPVTRATIAKYCTNNTSVVTTPHTPSITPQVTPQSNSGVTISSSVIDNSQIQNSTLFNPNSSSLFLQYLNPSDIQTTTPLVSGTSTLSTVLTPPSPISKTIVFVETPTSVAIGSSHLISFNESGFSGFDLVSIEGYKDDKQYFFGSTVPALGSYQITIPTVFQEKDSFTLIIKHNNDIKDSRTISVTTTQVVTE